MAINPTDTVRQDAGILKFGESVSGSLAEDDVLVYQIETDELDYFTFRFDSSDVYIERFVDEFDSYVTPVIQQYEKDTNAYNSVYSTQGKSTF